MGKLKKSQLAKAISSAEHNSIRSMIAAIPRGCVASYGELAARAGLPRRARLVGTVLRLAPNTLKLPWHRVVRSDGRIAFPIGSANFRDQRQRLQTEGVEVKSGRVDMQRYGWQRNLDQEIWGI